MTLGPDTLATIIEHGFGPITAHTAPGGAEAVLDGVRIDISVQDTTIELSTMVDVELPGREVWPSNMAERVQGLLRALTGAEVTASTFDPEASRVQHRHWIGRDGRHLDDLARAVSLLAAVAHATQDVMDTLTAQLLVEAQARDVADRLEAANRMALSHDGADRQPAVSPSSGSSLPPPTQPPPPTSPGQVTQW